MHDQQAGAITLSVASGALRCRELSFAALNYGREQAQVWLDGAQLDPTLFIGGVDHNGVLLRFDDPLVLQAGSALRIQL